MAQGGQHRTPPVPPGGLARQTWRLPLPAGPPTLAPRPLTQLTLRDRRARASTLATPPLAQGKTLSGVPASNPKHHHPVAVTPTSVAGLPSSVCKGVKRKAQPSAPRILAANEAVAQLEARDSGHPLRRSAPMRKPYARGSAAGLDEPRRDAQALKDLDADLLAASTTDRYREAVKWWMARCMPRQLPPFPLTEHKIKLAAGLLKHGRYRSGMIYLYGLRAAHLKDHPWPSSFRALYSSCKRSLERGLGPAKHAGALAVEKMCDAMQADALKQAATFHWPAAGIDALVVACAWGCREVESSTAFLKSVKVHQPTKSVGRWASWELPVSKADPKALGKHRALACASPAPTCPACAMHRVTVASWTIAKRLHPAGVPDTWPLLVTTAGNALSKTQTVAFYKEATRAVGETADLITGHSARSTCAIRMALAGHSLLVIQLFCRWGSSVVMRYVQEAPLGRHGGDIAAITEGQPRMDALQEAIMTKLQESMIQKKVGSLMDLSVEAVHALTSWTSRRRSARPCKALRVISPPLKLIWLGSQARKHLHSSSATTQLRRPMPRFPPTAPSAGSDGRPRVRSHFPRRNGRGSRSPRKAPEAVVAYDALSVRLWGITGVP